jgi:hypothetical protein
VRALNFNGRLQGIGNRLEEIIRLEALSDRWDRPINYFWRNPPPRRRWRRLLRPTPEALNRTYPILLRAGRVAILPGENAQAVEWDPIPELQGSFSGDELRRCAQRLQAVFPIGFAAGLEPVAIHLRGTDRIDPSSTHEHFLRSEAEFHALLERTAAAVNRLGPCPVFLCGDSAAAIARLRSLLEPGITLVDPVCPPAVPTPYRDFFALTACRAIYLASQFSSFSLTAALIGDRPIHMANASSTVRERYGARIEPLP